MGKIIKQGSGYAIQKDNGEILGLRRDEWYITKRSYCERIFNYIFYNEHTESVHCYEIHTKTGHSAYGTATYLSDQELETVDITELRDRMDIMFYNTNKLKDGSIT